MAVITPDSFNPLRRFVNVRLQQGVPIVDAEWNEKDDVRRFELRAYLKWFVGDGVPFGSDAFLIEALAVPAANDFIIRAGVPAPPGGTGQRDHRPAARGPVPGRRPRRFDRDRHDVSRSGAPYGCSNIDGHRDAARDRDHSGVARADWNGARASRRVGPPRTSRRGPVADLHGHRYRDVRTRAARVGGPSAHRCDRPGFGRCGFRSGA